MLNFPAPLSWKEVRVIKCLALFRNPTVSMVASEEVNDPDEIASMGSNIYEFPRNCWINLDWSSTSYIWHR